jgi:hypothetical protein
MADERSPMQRIIGQIKAVRGRLWPVDQYQQEGWNALNPLTKELRLERNVDWSGISEESRRYLMHREFTEERVLRHDENRAENAEELAELVRKYAPAAALDAKEDAARRDRLMGRIGEAIGAVDWDSMTLVRRVVWLEHAVDWDGYDAAERLDAIENVLAGKDRSRRLEDLGCAPDAFDRMVADLPRQWRDDGDTPAGAWEALPDDRKLAYLADRAAAQHPVSFERLADAAERTLGLAPGRELTSDDAGHLLQQYRAALDRHRPSRADQEGLAEQASLRAPNTKESATWPNDLDWANPPAPTRQGVEEQIRQLKAREKFTEDFGYHRDVPTADGYQVQEVWEQRVVGHSWSDLTEEQKLGQLQVATDVMLLNPEEKRDLLAREVDFSRVTAAQQEAYLGRPFDDLGKTAHQLRRQRAARDGAVETRPGEFECVAADLERQWYEDGLHEESGMTWASTRDGDRITYLADFAGAMGVTFERFAAAARDVLGLEPGRGFSPDLARYAEQEYERFREVYGRDRAEPMVDAARGPFLAEEGMMTKHDYTRLYRVEAVPRGGETPEWIKQGQDALGIAEASGRWFVADPALLDWYREDAAGPTRTVFVDVPTADLESYRVSSSTEQIGRRPVRSYSRDPENEFFLPRALAEKAMPQHDEHGEPPLDRAERQLREWKAANNGLSMEFEAGKLHVLEQDVDWTGVGDRDKQRVLAREVDFSKISRDELNDVYADIGSEDIDERPARRLFDEANCAGAVADARRTPAAEQLAQARDATRNLIEAIRADGWPRNAAIVDFGIDSQRHYEALYYPIRNHEIAPSVLDAAMGHGAKLTELTREAPSNPHKDIRFHTSWDELLGREEPETAGTTTSPADLVERPGLAAPAPTNGHTPKPKHTP